MRNLVPKIPHISRRSSAVSLLLFLLLLFSLDANAQTKVTVTGTVVDSLGNPIASVNIKSTKKNNVGTATDANGRFIIDVEADDVLEISFVGYETQRYMVPVKAGENLVITLQAEVIAAGEEVIVTAFGRKQQKEAVVGSVSTIDPENLRIPSSNLTNALAGQVAGIIAYQQSGQPGLDNSDFFVRGVTTFGYRQKPLILIDNIELSTDDLARLQVEDIATFSILKDASATALYGARGANGVILVTTKSGKEGRAKINIRLDQSASEPTRSIELADPITYMRMYNEALVTRDPKAIPFYTEDDIYNRVRTINNEPGSNKYVYPAVDWLGLMFKKRAYNQRATINVNGGGEVARYLVSASINNDNGILNRSPMNNFNNNVNFKNYQLRSNININISKNTELIVRLWGNFNDYSGPVTKDASFSSDLYNMATHTSPVLFPAYYEPDTANLLTQHILFGNNPGNTSSASNVGFQNPYAEMLRGYKRFGESKMLATLELDQKLDMITPGLTFHGFVSTNRYSRFENQMAYNPFYYTVLPGDYNISTNDYTLFWLNGSTNSSPLPTEYLNYSSGGTKANTFLQFQGQLDYTRKISSNHNISASLITVRQQTLYSYNTNPDKVSDLQASLPFRNLNLAGRASYNYSNRYFLEFNAGYNGTERFSKNNRYGFFPTLGASWIVSKEKFWEGGIATVITSFKIRASHGYSGNDNISDQRFFYLSDVDLTGGNGASFGDKNGYFRPGVTIQNYENRNVTWEKAQISNAAIEMTLFKNLDIVAEYWQQDRSNILMGRVIPAGAGLEASVSANVGTAKIKGVDLSVNYNQALSSHSRLSFMSNLTFSQGRYGKYEEPVYKEEWRYTTGTVIGQSFGYIAERLFVDDAEAASSPTQLFGGNLPLGGDIKYRDVNNDGVINDADKVPIGYPGTPQIIYGFGFAYQYKSFDLGIRFQGAARTSFFIDSRNTSPFISPDPNVYSGITGISQVLKVYADSYWSEENQNLYAVYPRLGTKLDELSNNFQTSTWWMRNGSFLRLKMTEIGYTLPQNIAHKLSLNSFRLFISGLNLFNFSSFKYWDIEQKGRAFNYPLQRVYNIGLNVNF